MIAAGAVAVVVGKEAVALLSNQQGQILLPISSSGEITTSCHFL